MSIYKVANYYQIKLAQNVQGTLAQVRKLLNLAQRLELRVGKGISGLMEDLPHHELSQQKQFQRLETLEKEPVEPGFMGKYKELSQQKPLQKLYEQISGKKTYPVDELKSKDFESKQKPQLLAAIQSTKYLYSRISERGIDASNFKYLLDKIKTSLLNAAMAGYTTQLTTDMLQLAQSIVPINIGFVESHVPADKLKAYKDYLKKYPDGEDAVPTGRVDIGSKIGPKP